MSPRGGEVDELWAAVGDPTRRQLLDAAARSMARVAAAWDTRLAAIKRIAESVARTTTLEQEGKQ